MAVVSVSLPDILLDQADRAIAERGFAGRSELVRAALRDLLVADQTAPESGITSATVTLLYAHGAERRIGEVRHRFTDVIQSMMHGHAEASCVELFLLKGEAKRIRGFVDNLRATPEARLVQAVYTELPTPDGPHDHAPKA